MEYAKSNRAIAAFLQDMHLRGIKEINPLIANEVSYPELSIYFGDEVDKALEIMLKDNIVRGYVVDRVLKCPECNTMSIRTRYLCPSCNSFNVERVSLLEHLVCGYIGSSRSFKKSGEQQVCPRCGRVLRTVGVDWRVIGTTFECYDCGYMFDEPKVGHICIPNGHIFDPTTSRYEPVYKYVIDEAVMRLVSEGHLINATVAHVLEKLGYRVQVDGVIKGLSGVDHKFKVIGFKGDQVIAVDTSNPSSSREYLMQMAAKVLDARPSKAILIVLSEKPLKDVEPLALTLNINLIVARNLAELEEVMLQSLSSEGKEEVEVPTKAE